MDKLSINIKIADREYPMINVAASEEEDIRYAGRVLNERLKAKRDEYGIEDKQDLLAMVAFDCMIEKLSSDRDNEIISENLSEKISDLDETISNALTD